MSTRPLSRGLQKVAEGELNEDPVRIEDDLSHIREWSEKQPHFNIRADDQIFLSFLRGCKFSLQRSKEKLDNYYTIRGALPEYFSRRNPLLPEIQHILNGGAIVPLPNTKDSIGPRIYFLRWEKCDVEKVTITNIFKTYLMIADILLQEDDNCAVSGIHLIADFKHFSPNYMLQLTPTFLKDAFYCLESAYPTRIKGLDCINIPPIFQTLFNLIKTFMSEKLKQRFHGFSSEKFDEFYKIIPQVLLPKEYGGEAGSIDEIAHNWKKKVEGYKNWLMEEEKYGIVEGLRPEKSDDSEDIFGMEGTFRKLNLD